MSVRGGITEVQSRGRSRLRLRRWLGVALIAAVIGAGSVTMDLSLRPVSAAAAELDAPAVFKVQAFYDRIDDDVDELRADFVLRVPHGFVNPETGALQSVDGLQLRIGYDYSNTARLSLRYINTMGDGAAGADRWARNMDEYFTVHSVIPSGKNDYLVISVEGNMDIPTFSTANNVPGGKYTEMNWYFSYLAGAPSTSTTWISSARTVEATGYYAYYGGLGTATAITGPQLKIQWDSIYGLWSSRQANWGQVLDYGLNGNAPGVLPSNSIPIDLVNNATRNTAPERGAPGTVSDSFWYAWVHEDGSLVESVNTGPIHVTGVPPRSARNSATSLVSKNIAASGTTPSLGWSQEQADQGLTDRVAPNGATDFSDAGGNGYYRILVWPEARDPLTPEQSGTSPVRSYTADELFDVEGRLTEAADAEKWTAGSAYYLYSIDLPDAPHIDVPTEGTQLGQNTPITLSGTGTPGHTITLKLAAGTPITDVNDPALITLVDGDHEGVLPDDIVVAADGTWSYSYVPETPLADGDYTVVALQTRQTPGELSVTSTPSNPEDVEEPTHWGVGFTVDTTAPIPALFSCPTSPTAIANPTFSGTGVEPGARVLVFEAGTELGEATVTDTAWSYTVSPDLPNGEYSFTVVQVDLAGNVSEPSAPPCLLRVAGTVPISGTKAVTEVEYPTPELALADPANWEITITADDTTQVISGDTDIRLDRDVPYTVGERLRGDPAPEPSAAHYAQVGAPLCVDGDGDPLPAELWNPDTQILEVPSESTVTEPLSCTLTNRAAHTSLLTQRVGGQTVVPGAGWELQAAAGETGTNFTLTEADPSQVTTPGDYALTGQVPDGLSIVGIQVLDVANPVCAAQAPNATAAGPECWIAVDPDAAHSGVSQGVHGVYRLVAAAPADLPSLPLTGGISGLTYTLGGLGSLAAAIIALTYRARRRHTSLPDASLTATS